MGSRQGQGAMGSLEVDTLMTTVTGMISAFVLALPVGYDREREDRSAGLRTFPLVATAASAYVLLAQSVFPDDPQAQARVLEGAITGIGFLGGGAILKGDTEVRGTATAASIWATAGIGAAAGYARYDIAIMLSLVSILTLRLMRQFKPRGGRAGR
jgi:putative Mg2+ transporter-C (MgtC) family protein